MNKFKHFVFVVTILIVTLLVVGNWITPVKANSVNIITPTPAGTPITDPNGQGESSFVESQGEPVSVEQREEVKAVIQEYFEIRYNALSISPSDDFQLNRF